jgi:hypothetical protein
MLTRFAPRWPQKTGNPAKDYDELVAALDEWFRRLNGVQALAISQAGINADYGIAFPATQNAIADVNTLDDYEEGSWTPIDSSGAALTFAAATGTYTKIGRIVIASFHVTYPATADGSNAIIGGLPFTIVNAQEARGHSSLGHRTLAALESFLGTNNATTLSPRTSTGGNITNATLTGADIYAGIIYPIS